MTRGKTAARGISAKLAEYFLKHPDQELYLKDIASAIGYSEVVTQSNINAIRGRNIAGAETSLETVVQGRIWIWHSKAVASDGKPNTPAKRMFEEIGPARDGSIVLQDTDGKLYRAQEL